MSRLQPTCKAGSITRGMRKETAEILYEIVKEYGRSIPWNGHATHIIRLEVQDGVPVFVEISGAAKFKVE